MKFRCLPALGSLLLLCLVAAPAAAGISPYVRLDYGGNGLRMGDLDKAIMSSQTSIRAAGYPADFEKIGSAYGASGAAGLWLFPAFRVGATYSYQKALRTNRVHVPGRLFYEQDLDMRMTEVGVEAAVRFQRLGGFIVGANVARGRAQMTEGLSEQEYLFNYQDFLDDTSQRTKTTYGGFIGFDQTNAAGVVGYIRAGFVYRDMGHMPGTYSETDDVTTVTGTGQTIWLDYSGLYLKVGVGFELVR